ncbi:50S ribosomal protein L32 [Pseudonocardia halophobica]|uniref:50S ribosomal protein L32 n=1 Tax=Pseudonocardia halophobica TaxID=29401 RepID=UPI003D8A3B36
MAVPKRRTSRSNTRSRRAQWRRAVRGTAPDLVPIVVDGRRYLVPRHLLPAYRSGLLHPEG